jgi:hypothetical protein
MNRAGVRLQLARERRTAELRTELAVPQSLLESLPRRVPVRIRERIKCGVERRNREYGHRGNS